MDFKTALLEGTILHTEPDAKVFRNLLMSSHQAINTAINIPRKGKNSASIFRELYEGLRQYCEAIALMKGYQFLQTELIPHFLSDILKEKNISERFDFYTKIRSDLDYNFHIDKDTITNSIAEITEIIEYLKKYTFP